MISSAHVAARASSVSHASLASFVSMSTVIENKPIEKKGLDNSYQPANGGDYQILLFNDNMNTREYVARCLCTIVGLSEGKAFEIMLEAHKNGMAVVGSWRYELAEAYNESLNRHGLASTLQET